MQCVRIKRLCVEGGSLKAKVKIQRDLKKIKTKVVFNLTLRQIICFSIGAVIGLPTYFFLKKAGNETVGMFAMIIVMLPAFLFAMYEKDGLPLEQILLNYWRWNHERPKKRVKEKSKSDTSYGKGFLNKPDERHKRKTPETRKIPEIKLRTTITNRKGDNTAGETKQYEKKRIRSKKYTEQRDQVRSLQRTLRGSESERTKKTRRKEHVREKGTGESERRRVAAL